MDSMKQAKQILTNLARAAWDNDTVFVGGGEFTAEDIKLAHAQLSRAVESHDALVSALDEAVLEAERIGFAFPADSLHRMRAALAKANAY